MRATTRHLRSMVALLVAFSVLVTTNPVVAQDDDLDPFALANSYCFDGAPADADRYNLILGTTDAETLVGTSGDDLILGWRDGTIFGGDGDDYICSYFTDRSVIYAGAGNDVVDQGGFIYGGPGNDVILDPNIVGSGGPGADLLVNNGYNSNPWVVLFGGDGDDIVIGGEETTGTLWGGNGNDQIRTGGMLTYAGSGDDDIYISHNGSHNSHRPTYAGPGDDHIVIAPRSHYDAMVDGGPGNDIFESSGNGLLFGGPGDDVMTHTATSGSYRNRMYGEAGNDTLTGHGSADYLDGGAGNDVLTGGGGDDLIFGGPDHDTLVGDGTARCFGGNDAEDSATDCATNGWPTASPAIPIVGDDDATSVAEQYCESGAAILDPETIYNIVLGTSGSELLVGTSGPDLIAGIDGDDVIKGHAGDDILCPGSESRAARVLGGPGDDVIDGGGVVFGGAGNDTLLHPYQIAAGDAGDDIIIGRSEADALLLGGKGADTIEGGTSSKGMIRGGPGADIITTVGQWTHGGPGNDAITMTYDNITLQPQLADGGSGDDHLIVDASFGLYPDGYGHNDNAVAVGGSGDDLIELFTGGWAFGGRGNDTLTAPQDESEVRLFGQAGNDVLRGGDGPGNFTGGDELVGGPGHDTIFGGVGNDLLFGGPGADALDGGTGSDRCFGGYGGRDLGDTFARCIRSGPQ